MKKAEKLWYANIDCIVENHNIKDETKEELLWQTYPAALHMMYVMGVVELEELNQMNEYLAEHRRKAFKGNQTQKWLNMAGEGH